MKFKPIHLIEAKVLNTIKSSLYYKGIGFLRAYCESDKFINDTNCNIKDIIHRIDAIEHNVWSVGPIEFFLDEMKHDWKISVNDAWDESANYIGGFVLENGDEKIGPFKSRYDAAVYGINMLLKEE